MNYCFDVCPHNTVERRFWEDKDGGKTVQHSKAVKGTNEKLKCELDYKQTVNSNGALVRSLVNNSSVCSKLKTLFRREIRG
jgi:hypothetical protein